MGEITISVKEYKELLEMRVRVELFADFVKGERFSINREECAKYLDFDLEREPEEP